jgi:hypothetical protein
MSKGVRSCAQGARELGQVRDYSPNAKDFSPKRLFEFWHTLLQDSTPFVRGRCARDSGDSALHIQFRS